MPAIDRPQRCQFIGVVGIIQLVANRARLLAETLIQLLPAFYSQPAFVVVASAKLLGKLYGLLRFLLAPLFAIHDAQLRRDASVSRIELSSLLQPLLSGGDSDPFVVSTP